MNIPTPAQVASRHTARLVAEGAHKPRVAYTSEATPAPTREHMAAVEVEDVDYGYRRWHHIPEAEVSEFIENLSDTKAFSDIDHSNKCWCQK